MTSDVCFTDEEFSFRHNGATFHVHTEVGNGTARVVVQEVSEQEPVDMEGDDS